MIILRIILQNEKPRFARLLMIRMVLFRAALNRRHADTVVYPKCTLAVGGWACHPAFRWSAIPSWRQISLNAPSSGSI